MAISVRGNSKMGTHHPVSGIGRYFSVGDVAGIVFSQFIDRRSYVPADGTILSAMQFNQILSQPKLHNGPQLLGMLLFCLFICPQEAHTQQTAPGREGLFELFNTRQGLSDNRITTLVQDKTGFIWVGTQNGLNRFDGYNFRQFFPKNGLPGALPGAVIQKLAIDVQGKLWVATDAGICRFNARLSQFDCFPTHLPGTDPRNAVILDFFPAPDGRLWLITRAQHLLVLDPTTGHVEQVALQVPPQPSASALVQAQSDDVFDVWGTADGSTIWIGGRSGIFRTDPQLRHMAYFPIPEAGVKGIQYVRQTTPNAVWVMVWQKGFYRFDLNTRRATPVPQPGTVPYSYLSLDMPGTVLLGSATGIARLSAGGGQPDHLFFDRERQERNIPVTALYGCPNGLIWVGTENGLLKYDPHLQGFDFTSLTYNRKSMAHYANDSDDVWHSPTDGRWYVASALCHAIFALDTRGTTVRSLKTAPCRAPTRILQDRQGRIWVGCSNALLQFAPDWTHRQTPATIPEGDPDNRTTGLVETADGTIWWATNREGLLRYDPDTRTTKPVGSADGFTAKRIVHMLADRQQRYLWITTDSEGFWELDRQAQRWRQYTDADSPGLSGARSMAQDLHGELWVGTNEGLLRYFPDRQTFKAELNREKGLPMNLLEGGLCDPSGILWWGMGDRIVRLDPLSAGFKIFDYRYGTGHTPFGYRQLSQSRTTGELYACGDGGFLRWHPDSLRLNTTLPHLVNTRLLVANREMVPEMDSVTRIGFSHRENTFSLEFSALNFTLPEENLYQWKLEGDDSGWSPPSTDRFVRLSFLPPGSYRLLVKAANNDGVWREQPLNILLRVFPAWWQTRLFQMAVLLLLSGAVLGILRYRRHVRQRLEAAQSRTAALEKQQLLSEIDLLKTQVNPHFLFNSLSILSSLVHVNPDLSEQFIEQLSRSYRYILEQKDQPLVTLRTELDFIRAYIFLLKIRFDNKFDVDIRCPEDLLDQYRVAPLTLQLLVENAVKHNRMSAKEPLLITVTEQDRHLVVRNPFRPRGNDVGSTGVGLQNIMNRYALLTGQRVWAGEQEGEFVVKVPLISH